MTERERAARKHAKNIVSRIDQANAVAHGAATNWCPLEAEELIVRAFIKYENRIEAMRRAQQDFVKRLRDGDNM